MRRSSWAACPRRLPAYLLGVRAGAAELRTSPLHMHPGTPVAALLLPSRDFPDPPPTSCLVFRTATNDLANCSIAARHGLILSSMANSGSAPQLASEQVLRQSIATIVAVLLREPFG